MEAQRDRLEKPVVLLRAVPLAIAMDTGFVLPEPHLGHLNLSAIASEILLRRDAKSNFI